MRFPLSRKGCKQQITRCDHVQGQEGVFLGSSILCDLFHLLAAKSRYRRLTHYLKSPVAALDAINARAPVAGFARFQRNSGLLRGILCASRFCTYVRRALSCLSFALAATAKRRIVFPPNSSPAPAAAALATRRCRPSPNLSPRTSNYSTKLCRAAPYRCSWISGRGGAGRASRLHRKLRAPPPTWLAKRWC